MSVIRIRHCHVVLAMLACVAVGCRSIPQSYYCSQINQQPRCCVDNVHAIFVDSPFDVLNIGQFEQVANSLRRSGCSNIEVFSFYKQGNDKRLAERIREVRTQNPNGRIVLVGYSMGALMMERALAMLEPEGVVVDSAI